MFIKPLSQFSIVIPLPVCYSRTLQIICPRETMKMDEDHYIECVAFNEERSDVKAFRKGTIQYLLILDL